MKRPEISVTPFSVEDIEPLIEAGADAFLIGEERYGLCLAGEFKREDIRRAAEAAHRRGKKVYVSMNALFHNDLVDELADYVAFLQECGADAVIFGDPAVLMTVRETAPGMNLHWDPEMTATNWYSCNYWGRKGAKRAVLSRELSMDEILEIKDRAEVEIEVQVHGMTCMFHSKRKLIGNYFAYRGKQLAVERGGGFLFLFDKERNNKYPIFEDANGTHIMSPNDICIIDELGELIEAGIDCFRIDGIFKDPAYLKEVTKAYRTAVDAYLESPGKYGRLKGELLAKIQAVQPKNRPLDTGFFFKETVY